MMDKAEKKEFITAIIGQVQAEIISSIHSMPEEWDGMELRKYISDKMAECYWRKMQRSRLMRYNNDRLVKNL